MQLFDRLFKIKRDQQKPRNDNSIKTADLGFTTSSPKRFTSLRHWRSISKPISHGNSNTAPTVDQIQQQQQQQQQQQDLLTLCIETALYTSNNANNKRWSHGDALTGNSGNILFCEQQESSPPRPQPRQRKLSLPPQLTNIGYLASIPEVDSQITLDLCSKTNK